MLTQNQQWCAAQNFRLWARRGQLSLSTKIAPVDTGEVSLASRSQRPIFIRCLWNALGVGAAPKTEISLACASSSRRVFYKKVRSLSRFNRCPVQRALQLFFRVLAVTSQDLVDFRSAVVFSRVTKFRPFVFSGGAWRGHAALSAGGSKRAGAIIACKRSTIRTCTVK